MLGVAFRRIEHLEQEVAATRAMLAEDAASDELVSRLALEAPVNIWGNVLATFRVSILVI